MGFRTIVATALSAVALPAMAQQAGTGIHTSPGMPLMVAGKPSFSPASLPRFWTTSDSVTSITQRRQAVEWLQRRLVIPNDFLEHTDYALARGTLATAHFEFRLIVRPDGIVKKPKLLKQEISDATLYSPESLLLLVQEAERKFGQLRFTPAATQDTITLPVTFGLR